MSERERAALVIVPTYNEADNLGEIVRRVRSAEPAADILVVDDDSPDGTGKLADAMAVDDPAVQVLHRVGKQGLGAAYLAGFGWGLERGYPFLVEMDADGSHPPERLPTMLATARDGAGLVIGSRWVRGGAVRNWPLHRLLLSRGANTYARFALGIPVRDATAGYRVFRRETLLAIDLDSVSSRGYCFQIDLTLRTDDAGVTTREVPITFVERERGESKMSGSIVVEALVRVTLGGDLASPAGRVLDTHPTRHVGWETTPDPGETMKNVRIRWVPAVLLLTPVVEIVVIVLVANWIGWAATIAALAALSVVGVILMRRSGRQAWAELSRDRSVGTEPPSGVVDRALTFLGGLILVPPGFVKDLVALVLLLPFTRPLVRNRIQSWAVRKGTMYVSAPGDPTMSASRHGPTTPHGPDVVRGEVIDDD
ncbi:FxsA family protein [Solicola gregarius]|uniref:FxsA family protein n=1 Tax=Solicola gregarius TaxID=2908642 RepID=A0AA46TGS8_9ACTN|nr:FxsA family protein [Solicola gregarius]UYM05077.1 FxsA family protein [Solicola gregarius]